MGLIERYEQGESFGDLLAEADAEVAHLRKSIANSDRDHWFEEAGRLADQLRGAVCLTDADRRFIERVLLRHTAGPDRRYAESIVAKLTTTGGQ